MIEALQPRPPRSVRPSVGSSIVRRLWRDRWIYVCLIPSLTLYGLFVLWPIIASYWYSFLDWNGFDAEGTFIGLANYVEVIQDPMFWSAFRNSFLYMGLVVPLRVGLALLIALVLNDPRLPFANILRTAFFLPVVTTTAIVGVMMTFILDPGGGPLNLMLMKLGLVKQPVDFLGSNIGLFTAVGVDVWKWFGLTLVYWLAALQTIPQDIKEAAYVDGARGLQMFFRITLPLLYPFVIIITLITALGALHGFDLMLTLTGGGPALSTEIIELYIYRWAFSASIPRLGYASAAAVFFGLTTLVLAIAQFLALRSTQRMRG